MFFIDGHCDTLSETLDKKTEIFIATLDKMVQISLDASKRRAEDAVRLKEREKQSIAQSSQRKTVQSLAEVSGGVSSNE